MNILFRKLSGITYPLLVQPTDTILRIKQKIMQKSSIQIAQQTLIYKGNVILEDNHSFSQYNIQEKEVVHIIVKKIKKNPQYVPAKKIFIQTVTQKIYEIIVKPNDSIRIVKEKIQDKIGCPPIQQVLRYEGKKLQDNYLLEDYKISNQETLKLFQDFSYNTKNAGKV